MDAYGETNVVCPFFHRQQRMGIVCEGPFAGENTVSVSFETKWQMEKVRRERCNSSPELCPIYRAVMEKYGDED